jgi:SanA protein
VRDFAGFRTFDSVYRARDLWGIRSMVIVSQDFHLPRSIYIAQRLGVDAVGLSADRRRYLSIQRAEAREVFARAAAWLDLNLLGTKPRFLGPPETFSGEEQDRAWKAQTGRRAAGTN